ncbi:MAG: signal peptidase I, partial [Candidatus Brockarchaeota archaeon]|nr:signal peptidase I [Candidatus Brockarchaeota archaeon]
GLGMVILLPSLKVKHRVPSEGLILLRDGGRVKGFKHGVSETVPRVSVKLARKKASEARRFERLIYIKYAVILLVVLEAYLAVAYAFKTFTPVMVVCSGSMRPTLNVGDLVLVEGVDAWNIRKGDIIAFNVPQPYARSTPSPVMHRVVEVCVENDRVYFKTKGDANASEDPWTITGESVIGRLLYKVPYLGYPVYVLKTNPYVFATVIALFAVWLVYSIVKGRRG